MAMFPVIVNGELKKWFKAQWGIWQGDPISPLLFTLVVDVLSRMFQRGMDKGLMRGLLVGNDLVKVSHLQFTNDTILFLPIDANNLLNALS